MPEAAAGMPKELRAKCEIDDENATLTFQSRSKTVTIKHDSSMLAPILNINPGIRKHQQFSASFCTLIQDESESNKIELTFNHNETEEDTCAALNAVSTQSRIQKLLQAEDLIKENADISKKL